MRRRLHHFYLAGIMLALSSAAPAVPTAWGQIFADEEARAQGVKNQDDIAAITSLLRELDAKIKRLEQARTQTAALTQKTQQLETQLRTLNGKAEELAQLIKVSKRERNAALSAQRNKQEKHLADLHTALAAAQAQIAALQENLKELSSFVELPPEETLYASAYAEYQRNDLQAAITGFNRVLRYYPQGQFAANCLYWLGQAHLAQEDFAAARNNAETLITRYPRGDRRADAMLIRARALSGLGDAQQAMLQLQALISEYPTSLAADSARQLLAQ